MNKISLTELEEAINYWRTQRPATGEECALSPEVNALANVYAMLIIHHTHAITIDMMPDDVRQLLTTWEKLRS